MQAWNNESTSKFWRCFEAVNPFNIVHVKIDGSRRIARQKFDLLMTFVLAVLMIAFSAYQFLRALDADLFESACYSSNSDLPGDSNSLRLKHLCYDQEKPTSFSLVTYTCQGTFGAFHWGVIDLNTPNTITGPTQQPLFCAKSIHNGESELRPFMEVSLAQGCSGNACPGTVVDTSKTYRFLDQTPSGDFYAVLGDQPDGFHCCGMRTMDGWGRFLHFVATVGGFMGFIKGLALSVPYCCGKRSSSIEGRKGTGTSSKSAVSP